MPTPAEELKAAVKVLRGPDGTITVTIPAAAADAMATLLDRQGRIAQEMQDYLGNDFQDGALDHDTHDALAVARALNGDR
ncbi:hypothetical protein [Streptomyces sp. NPDC055607]